MVFWDGKPEWGKLLHLRRKCSFGFNKWSILKNWLAYKISPSNKLMLQLSIWSTLQSTCKVCLKKQFVSLDQLLLGKCSEGMDHFSSMNKKLLFLTHLCLTCVLEPWPQKNHITLCSLYCFCFSGWFSNDMSVWVEWSIQIDVFRHHWGFAVSKTGNIVSAIWGNPYSWVTVYKADLGLLPWFISPVLLPF